MKKTIIICDDDEGILEVVKIVLEEKGYDVIALSNPEKVLDTIKNSSPHLILLDLWMPILNGDLITQTLKSSEETKNIPVIIFSANKDTAEIAKQIGADNYLTKPFDIDQLEKLVDSYM
jgi:DNA-binding response OmpR family regulator